MTTTKARSDDITVAPINIDNGSRKVSVDSSVQNGKKKKNSGKSMLNFLYNPRKKTVLGGGSLKWGNMKILKSIIFSFYSS